MAQHGAITRRFLKTNEDVIVRLDSDINMRDSIPDVCSGSWWSVRRQAGLLKSAASLIAGDMLHVAAC